MSLIHSLQSLPGPVLQHWGYWIIFLASILEAMPLFGAFIPGHSLVIFGWFLVKLHVLHFGFVVIVSALWAIFGDFSGYLLGRRYGHEFIRKYGKYIFFKEEYFEKAKRLIADHTGKTIIIGRFNPVMRALVPFVSGSSGIGFWKFSLYTIIGWVSWALSSVFIGYLFGQSYEIAAKYIGRFFAYGVIISIALMFIYRFVNKRKHIFLKYRPYLLVLNIASLYLFFKMLEDVLSGELITKWDTWVHAHIISLWNVHFNMVMIFLSYIGSPVTIGALSVLLFTSLLYRKRWYHASIVPFAMLGWWMLEYAVKISVGRPRPETALIMLPSSYSFPSAHATMTIIFFSLLIYIFQDEIKDRWMRVLFIALNIGTFLSVGFSRIYLGVHWLSDVLAGFGLGLFWLTFVILASKIIVSFLQGKKEMKVDVE